VTHLREATNQISTHIGVQGAPQRKIFHTRVSFQHCDKSLVQERTATKLQRSEAWTGLLQRVGPQSFQTEHTDGNFKIDIFQPQAVVRKVGLSNKDLK
jgi:hypothetical protein